MFSNVSIRNIYYCRSNEDSFSRGVLSEAQYEMGNKRRLVSLKICFMTWLYEMIGVAFTILTPYLNSLGVPYLSYPDAILLFVVIPFLHIMNDEDTKTVITNEGWIEGIKHMLGIRSKVTPVQQLPHPNS